MIFEIDELAPLFAAFAVVIHSADLFCLGIDVVYFPDPLMESELA